MTANDIRQAFLDFFISKKHQIVPSAPMVVKNDPTLMFTNAGMNQFKDLFLGNDPIKYSRIADTQKCLRVSGKHNDLEEVGHDTYHHTMFEMLGNWSFGDYFKTEAIGWAWEFLTEELKIDESKLYATVFEGDKQDGTEFDKEAFEIWNKYLPEERILNGNKKDNFWEMGETGPCGPCSEIHIDLRDDDEIAKLSGRELVNKDHPLVIEIWNLVFIQYNRKANGQLEMLPDKHIDTGMGFERLCMVVQNKKSNYDTDVFQPIISEIGALSNIKYGTDEKSDIAMRVIADHLRTISFAIAEGQLPSNNKAGYVIRRILRRAVRYGYTFLNQNTPFIHTLLPVLQKTMGNQFPELVSQASLIENVIKEEENSFLKTLETGIKLLEKQIEAAKKDSKNTISGKDAFILYDTYGFPFDLTELILRENNFSVNKADFEAELEVQKNRSRQATDVKTGDWVELSKDEQAQFIGYDFLESDIEITRYRKVSQKNKEFYQLVFNTTPFYAESGGQVGDTGYIESDGIKTSIIDTQKENNLTVHIAKELPKDPTASFKAVVSSSKRKNTACNHTATHLLHKALQEVLGTHVEQKGSLVNSDYLRFDFSHFQKVSAEELEKVEDIVNDYIRRNISLNEKRSIPIAEAQAMGAKALFGEKYGEEVRVIQYEDSIELCGGTHVNATGEIGYFKIISEGAIAAGIRRIEAISSEKSHEFIKKQNASLNEVKALLKNPKNIAKSVEELLAKINDLQKAVESFNKDKIKNIKQELKNKVENINGINFLSAKLDVSSANDLKDLSFQLKDEIENLFFVSAAEIDGKANLSLIISDTLVKEKELNAGNIIREISKHIQGGGGGQAFYASAGGKKPQGIEQAFEQAKELL